MHPIDPSLIKDGVHRNLPKSRDLRFPTTHRPLNPLVITTVPQSMIEGVRPVRIGIGIRDGDGGTGGAVVEELGVLEDAEGVEAEVQIRGSETSDVVEWDAGEGVEGD